jgi:uncharacterized protein
MRTVRRTVAAPPDLGTAVIGVPAGTDLELDLRLEAVMEGVLVSGRVRGTATGECVRCLGDVEAPFDIELQELFVYPDHALDDEEEELRRIEDRAPEGAVIDLEPALRDAVVPALPFQPVCRADCPGLCPQCGLPLADNPDHRHEELDPRWQALWGLVPEGGPAGPLHDEQKES